MKLFRRRVEKLGLPPGTPVFVGDRKVEQTRLTVIDYDDERLEERELGSVEECFPYRDTGTVTWVNVDGVHDVELVQQLCSHFGVHPLVQEDIVNTAQRPKVEEYDDRLYIVVRMLYRSPAGELVSEQVSLILGEHFVISFQEQPGDVFEALRERLRQHKGRARKTGPDYLAYLLLDAVVDGYFLLFEPYGERSEKLEAELMSSPTPKSLQAVQRMKRELLFLRKAVWPLRELLAALQRTESKLVRRTTGVYLRDVYDHTIQVIDTIETFRDTASGLLDMYLSSVSNRTNEVMKVLTIIATIFIPLTFIAGVYGMNFRFMPELRWPWGYFGALGVMAVVALVMVVYFKRKKWL